MRLTPARLTTLFVLFSWLTQAKPTWGQASAPSPQAVSVRADSASRGLEGMDAFVQQAMKDWKVPGMAIAVVKEGKVIWSKGFGLRNVEKKLPVTPRTIFAIGSATKSFTVAALAALAGEGKLDWDKPVRDYVPEFRLLSEVATAQMTPRDLVTHRSGLPRHDAVWYNAEVPRPQLVERLRYLEPNQDLRAKWQYNNLMFLAAGYLAGKLSGLSWEETVRQRIFKPLQMNRSNFSVGDSQKSDDYALPYEKDDQENVRRCEFRNIDQIGPAGSINSSVEDMIWYVMLQLNQGKRATQQVIAEADVQQMQTPQMVTPAPVLYPEISHTSYGLGFFVTTYRGHKLVHHGGNIDGFSALVSFMPQDNMGMVILSNLDGTPLPSVVSYNVYDRLLGLEMVDWNQRLLTRVKQSKASEDEAKAKGYTPRRADTKPSHSLEEYTGEYQHPAYGTVRIDRSGENFTLTFHRFTSPLKHFHYDIFEIPPNKLDRLERMKVMFHTDWNGEIASLSAPLEPEVHDIVFVKKGDPNMRQPDFLKKLVGRYQLGPNTISFALRGDNTLLLSMPGRQPMELVPIRGMKFNIQGESGAAVEFISDKQGDIVEAVFLQPDGSYVAKRLK